MQKRFGAMGMAALLAAGFWLYQARPAAAPAAPRLAASAGVAGQRVALNPWPAHSGAQAIQLATEAPAVAVYDNQVLAAEARRLTQQWQAQLVAGPGWLHLLEQIERHDDTGGPLPNGQAIPASFLFDQWFELDANGQVVREVSLMRALDSQVIQVGVFQEGVWRNPAMAEGETPNLGTPEPPSLDFNFVRDLAQANTWGARVTVNRREVVSAEGHRQVIFEIRDALAPAQPLANNSAEVSAQTISLTIDATTGQVVGSDTFAQLASGEVLPTEHSQYVTVEHVAAAPAEILAYLK